MLVRAAEDWLGFTALIARLLKTKAWPAEFDALRAWYEPHLPRILTSAPRILRALATNCCWLSFAATISS